VTKGMQAVKYLRGGKSSVHHSEWAELI